MAMNMEIVGRPLAETRYTYTWKEVVLYALAVGAQENDLDLLLELRPAKVLPTFSVVPTFDPLLRALAASRVDLTRVLHGEQFVRLYGAIPRQGTLVSVPIVSGIYDVGKHAIWHLDTVTRQEGKEDPLFETRWTIVLRGAGGFGGERPPTAELFEPPVDRAPDFVRHMPTARTQALLYRLSGDVNPLHVDPALAKLVGYPRPILHGLCTYGHVGLAVLQEVCGGKVGRIQSFFARFSKEVYPGDTITVEGWMQGEQEVLVRARVDERVVLSNGRIVLD